MGLIIKEYNVTGTRRSDVIRARFNAEAKDSLVRRDVAEFLGEVVDPPLMALKEANNVYGALSSWAGLPLGIDVDGVKLLHYFYVPDVMDDELVIGVDIIRKWRIGLDFDNDTITIDPQAESLAHRTGIAIPVPYLGE